MRFLPSIFGRNKAQLNAEPVAEPLTDDDPLIPIRGDVVTSLEGGEIKIRKADADMITPEIEGELLSAAADSVDGIVKPAVVQQRAADATEGSGGLGTKATATSVVPDGIQNWFTSSGFIGWQACALIAQQWLVEKACSMPGKDAIRNGFELSSADGQNVDTDVINKLQKINKKHKLLQNCAELVKFNNIFGIRIVIFEVESEDPRYYEKPFNIDGVTRGSYRGMSQVDPYWTAPLLDSDAGGDPASKHFYEPTYWVIGGKKYHRSHLHIVRGADVADILKPSYYYGGVPLTQRIYERVYAAERTANEAPMLAMSKRTTVLKVDTKKATANFKAVTERLLEWISFRDNYAVKVIDTNEEMQNQDTSLADLDAVIMTQYQLVAAISGVPATKLLGTSPKGFGASGEYEELSYHELLETIQTEWLTGLVDRHLELVCRSEGIGMTFEVSWNPVGTKTPEQLATLNKDKAEVGERLINSGVISPDEERQRVRNDPHSGYAMLGDEDADQEIIAHGHKGDLNIPAETDPDVEASSPTDSDVDGIESHADFAESHVSPDTRGGLIPSVKPSVAPSVKPSVNGTVRGAVNERAGLIDLLGLVSETLAAIQGKGADADEGRYSVSRCGWTLLVETAQGETREGTDLQGNAFSCVMPVDYGYFKGYKGADGDSVDAFIGPSEDATEVYVINQNNPDTGLFDEHKVMIGFDSPSAAKACYDAAHDDAWDGFDNMVTMSPDQFKEWMNMAEKDVPASLENMRVE